jgi:DNA polymerase-3 subunit gamma/tau
VVDVRRLWPEVLEKVKARRRFTWILLSQHAQVDNVADATLTLALANPGARESFLRSGNEEILRQSLMDVLGVDWRVEAVLDPTVGGGNGAAAGAPPAPGAGSAARTAEPAVRSAEPQPAPPPEDAESDGDAHPDDPVVHSGSVEHTDLLVRELGAQVIEEISHD